MTETEVSMERHSLSPAFLAENMMGPNSVRILEELLDGCTLRPGMRVLDLGCGRGLTSVWLAEQFDVQVFAVDLWIPATENYRRFCQLGLDGRIVPLHADANALPFAEGYFDAMVSVDAYHYFGLEADFFPRVIRPLLKENALTAIAVPGMKQPMQDVPPEMTPYWRPEDLACWQTADFWDGRLDSLTERKSWEMACFDTAWTEWMATDNPYAVSDRPMMATDGGRYMNLVAVRGKAAPYSG